MDIALTPTQEMLKSSARDFLEKECPPSLVQAAEEDPRGYPPELWAKIASLGWPGLLVPGKHGGSGATLLEAALLMEEAGRAALPGPLLPVLFAGLLIQEAGSADMQRRLLPPLARGEHTVSPALMEPEEAPVRAEPHGAGYRLWGTKFFVPCADTAAYLIVSAATPRGDGLFLVEAGAPGLGLTPLLTTASDHQFEVRLEATAAEFLGGGEALGRAVDGGTVLYCAYTVGSMQAALELSVDYTRQRHQFGRPIGSFQAVHHHLVDMYRDLQVARLLIYQAAWRWAAGLEAGREVSLARIKTSAVAPLVTSLAHQVHGGVGFYTEYPLELHYRRALAGAVALGGAAGHRERLARYLAEMGEEH
jgi:alkylation response protein AidB-like acyl-CoA dehydrogenase